MATKIRYKATGHTRVVADFAARNLITSGIAQLANQAQGYDTRQMTPEAAPAAAVAEVVQPEAVPAQEAAEAEAVPKPKRAYKRRDQTARNA